MLDALWNALNSPVAIAALAGLVLWLLNRLYAARPEWKRWEGTIVAAVKAAEKAVPDEAEHKALRRLNEALNYVQAVFEEVEHRRATEAEVAALKEGIQIKHAELEAAGGLKP